jgi:hypothetical protein
MMRALSVDYRGPKTSLVHLESIVAGLGFGRNAEELGPSTKMFFSFGLKMTYIPEGEETAPLRRKESSLGTLHPATVSDFHKP